MSRILFRRNLSNTALKLLVVVAVVYFGDISSVASEEESEGETAGETQYIYYCPRTNTRYVGTANGIGLVDGPYAPFPRNQSATTYYEEPVRSSLRTTDCSTSEFLCLRLEPKDGLTAQHLFIPRVIEPGKTYNFNGMDAIAYYTTAYKQKGTQAQVTLWQRVQGQEVPITLTVERGRGVIYIDGLALWSSPLLWPPRPDLCVLDSNFGLFKDIKISVPEGTQ